MNKPPRTEINPDEIPDQLKELPQWVCWRYILKDGKWTKIPFRPNGMPASTTDPATWSHFSVALDTYRQRRAFDGIGFVFAPDDSYCGVDIDNCIEADGKPKDWAKPILQALSTVAYCEVSPSGTGYKAWTRGIFPPTAKHRTDIEDGHIEAYDHARYFTATGTWYDGEIAKGQERIDWLADRYLKTTPAATPNPRGNAAKETRSVTAIISEIRNSRQASKFDKLFRGDWSDYKTGTEGASRADEALTSIAAFWTQDPAAIDAVFRQSGLMRPKWDEKHAADGRTYGQMTIDFALANLRETKKPKHHHKSYGTYTQAKGGYTRAQARGRGNQSAQGRYTRR